MTVPAFVRDAKHSIVGLALQLIDPCGASLATIILAPGAIQATLTMARSGFGPSLQSTTIAWSIALMLGNILSPIKFALRRFDATERIADELDTRPALFYLGGALAIATSAALPAYIQALSIPSYDLLSTILLGSLPIVSLVAAIVGFVNASVILLHAVAAHRRSASLSRKRYRLLGGALMLCGGVAEGIFRRRNLSVGAPHYGEVLLYGELSAKRGTLAVGSPGSSKTRAKIYPDLYWGLRSSASAGALVFVTKRRATDDCRAIAEQFRTPEKIHVVGVGRDREHMDITAHMTHESIGDAIQDGMGVSHSDFWRHGPSAFIEGFVEIIKALAPTTIRVPADINKDGHIKPSGEAYDLHIADMIPTLLKLTVLDGRRLDAVFTYGFNRVASLRSKDERSAHQLHELLHDVRDRILPLMLRDPKLGEELRQSVLPQLQPFARGSVREAFCDRSGLDLGVIEQGHVVLVEIDEAEYPRAVATIIRMIFRRIVQMARDRTAGQRVAALNPILLVCDEYTNYAAPGHIQAWNTVRESNFCATVGITSVSALAKQLGGDQHAANAIIANFANKFFFEVDDKPTRDLARELIGHSTIVRRSTSESTSASHGSSWNGGRSGGGSNASKNTTRGTSSSEHREDIIDGGVWRLLRADRQHARAIAFVRTPSGVCTDVVSLGVLDPGAHIATALPESYGLA